MSINTHIPLKYCFGFTPFRDQLNNRKLIVKMGEVITQDVIDSFEGDSSKFLVMIRPEVNLADKIKMNIELEEAKEEKKLERILKKIDSGEILFEQNSTEKTIFILMDGEVEVILNGSLIAELKEKGSFIGEMSIVLSKPRSATIKARTNCTFYCIDGSDLLALAKNSPVILSRLCQSLANKIVRTSSELSMLKMADNTKSHTRKIYKPIQDDTRFVENLSQYKGKVYEFKANDHLFLEGDMSFDMFVLIEGEVRVSIGGEAIVRISSPGTLIGEMSSLRIKPRSATVTAVVPSKFYKIQGLRLMETCKEDPQFLIKLAQILANRLALTSSEYAYLLKASEN